MSFKTYMVEAIVAIVLNKEVYNLTKDMVEYYTTKTMTSARKRSAVVNKIKHVYPDVKTSLINIGIEIAYYVLTSK